MRRSEVVVMARRIVVDHRQSWGEGRPRGRRGIIGQGENAGMGSKGGLREEDERVAPDSVAAYVIGGPSARSSPLPPEGIASDRT
jgi:hypothetical protein